MFDVNNDEELVSLMSNIADWDEMVMEAIMSELESSWEDREARMYSAVESGYKEPRGYKMMLK